MGFFSKHQSPDMPPLVEAPKAGEPIVFDEEEQQAIDKKVQRELEYLSYDSKGKVFPAKVIEGLTVMYAKDALRKIVQQRLACNNLEGAATTNIKLLGIATEIMPHDYLSLAKIFALHGDSKRAKNYISAADNTRKKLRMDKSSSLANEGWRVQVAEVTNIIHSIQD